MGDVVILQDNTVSVNQDCVFYISLQFYQYSVGGATLYKIRNKADTFGF